MVMITLHLHHETCSAFAMPFFVKSRLFKTRLYSERVKFLLITAMFFKLKYYLVTISNIISVTALSYDNEVFMTDRQESRHLT